MQGTKEQGATSYFQPPELGFHLWTTVCVSGGVSVVIEQYKAKFSITATEVEAE